MSSTSRFNSFDKNTMLVVHSNHSEFAIPSSTRPSFSSFAPYVTTVGLYNDQRDLIAVGKLAQPTPISKTTDTTILINVDRQ